MTLRIYSETLPLDVVSRSETVELLARYGLEIVLAVRPWQLDDLPRVARALEAGGVPLSIWPMLSDEEGRWASVHNARKFAELVDATARVLAGAGLSPREAFFDLEPPFGEARTLVTSATGEAGERRAVTALAREAASFRARARAGAAFAEAESVLASSIAGLRDRGIRTAAAVWPLVALDSPSDPTWQRILGTPVDALGVDRVSVMAYTTIFAGWSRGAVRRRDATALLARATARTLRRWGDGGGISLGCVGTGAFEDEPVYASPADLAEDVAVARAEGCTDLTLFDLGGVLARAPAEPWLDAFVLGARGADPRARTSSKRVAAARALVRAATWALARRR